MLHTGIRVKKKKTLFLPVLLLMYVFGRFVRFVFAGNPCVTMAPKCDSDSPPVHQMVETPTRLSLIDQQVCTRLKIFIHTLHFDMLKRAIIFPQVLNEVDVWEEDCSDEDPNSSACSDYRAIQRYRCLRSKCLLRLQSVHKWDCTFELKLLGN